MDCYTDCNNDQQCLLSCMREADKCTEKCPCENKCPNGCPCPYNSEWCDADMTCRDQFEEQYQQIRFEQF